MRPTPLRRQHGACVQAPAARVGKANFTSSQSCYRDEVYQSMGDTNPPTVMIWCGTYSTGGTVYRTSPARKFGFSTAIVRSLTMLQKARPPQPIQLLPLGNRDQQPQDCRPTWHPLRHRPRHQKALQLVPSWEESWVVSQFSSSLQAFLSSHGAESRTIFDRRKHRHITQKLIKHRRPNLSKCTSCHPMLTVKPLRDTSIKPAMG
jgi:hypothetical protein